MLTATFKGQSVESQWKVVKSLDMERSSAVADSYIKYVEKKEACEDFVKAYGNGVTKKNRYKILKAYKKYVSLMGDNMSNVESLVYSNNEVRNGKWYEVKSIIYKGHG